MFIIYMYIYIYMLFIPFMTKYLKGIQEEIDFP